MNDFQALAIRPSDVIHYIQHYQYGDDGTGEDGKFNCWGLLRDIQSRFFGIDLPRTSLGNEAAYLYDKRMKSGDWELVDKPFHGAGVLMRSGHEPHCGVWLDFDGGGVLHCERGSGVRFQKMADLRVHGYSNLKYYRFNNG